MEFYLEVDLDLELWDQADVQFKTWKSVEPELFLPFKETTNYKRYQSDQK